MILNLKDLFHLEPGELLFQEATYHVDYQTGIVTATAIRIHGCDGSISVCYRTM